MGARNFAKNAQVKKIKILKNNQLQCINDCDSDENDIILLDLISVR